MAEHPFTVAELTTLMQEFSKHGLGELFLKTADSEVCLRAAAPPPILAAPTPASPAATPYAPPQTAAEDAFDIASEIPAGNLMTAPIVGTFYQSPAPDQGPFVTVGQRVKKGDVLFIIESMKLMNEVHSEFDGEVVAILCDNASPVEYDQPIMVIR